jgi:hypothetical protein
MDSCACLVGCGRTKNGVRRCGGYPNATQLLGRTDPTDAASVRSVRIYGLVARGGFSAGFEALGEQDDGRGDERDDADQVEAVHEGEELSLRV